jgi:hypothetical protein
LTDPLLLSLASASAQRLAVVGLAKNTGKTVALNALLRELEAVGRTVGVTSVGRDGEERDVIDAHIEKPLVRLAAGSIVASTHGLLRASGLAHELLSRTGVRTPLGEVAIARLREPGTIEVAGPSAAVDVREAADAMLSFGAEQVLIDGAVDRRAASSPEVSDALVMATGAVLSGDIEEVVARTRDAVELVRLPTVEERLALGELAQDARSHSLLLDGDGGYVQLPERFVLTAQEADVAEALVERSGLLVAGALPEAFVRHAAVASRRTRREFTLVVGDPTRVFLSEHGPEHYRRQGVRIETLRPIDLRALTVNPVAPRSHSFDSARLRALLAEQIAGVAVLDVMDPEYGKLAIR